MKRRLKGLVCWWLALVMLVSTMATPAMALSYNRIYIYTETVPLETGDNLYDYDRQEVSEGTQLSSLVSLDDGVTLTGWNLWEFDNINSGYVIIEKLLTKDADWTLSAVDVEKYANGDYYVFEPLYAYSAEIDVYIGENMLSSYVSVDSGDIENRQIALDSALNEQGILSDRATENLIGWKLWEVDSGYTQDFDYIEANGTLLSADNNVKNPLLEAMYATAGVATNDEPLASHLEPEFNWEKPIYLNLGTALNEQSDVMDALETPAGKVLDGWKLWRFGNSGWVYEAENISPKSVASDYAVTYEDITTIGNIDYDYFLILEPQWKSVPPHTHPICGAEHSDIGDHTGNCEDITWTAVSTEADLQAMTSGGSYYLANDIELTSTLFVSNINLCLNGFELRQTGNSAVIQPNAGVTLNICDCSEEQTGTIAGGRNSDGAGIYASGGSGSTTTVNIYGGNIIECEFGAGIGLLYDTTANIYNGKITDNNGGYGGVYCYFGATLNMYGGEISGNTATYAGGGIWLYRSTLNVSGDVKIRGNTLNGSPNNLHIEVSESDPAVVSIGEMADNSDIGVTIGKAGYKEVDGEYQQYVEFLTGTISANGASYIDNFFSDVDEYTLATDGEGLKLIEKPTTIPVTGVTLNKSKIDLYLGTTNTASLTTTVEPDNATNKTVTWTSDDMAVATVDQNGVVTAVGKGYTRITATAADGSGKSDSLYVYVYEKIGSVTINVTPPVVDGTVNGNNFSENSEQFYIHTKWWNDNDGDVTVEAGKSYKMKVVLAQENYHYFDSSTTASIVVSDDIITEGVVLTTSTTPSTCSVEYTFNIPPDEYNVKLNANGGTINSGNITSYIAGEETVLPTDISKEGHSFAGWYEDENFTGSAVTRIESSDTGDKEYFAKWTTLKYPVTFNAGEGTFADGSKEITLDVEFGTIPVAAEIPVLAGYVFAGWNPALAPVTVEGAIYTATYTPDDVSYFVEIYTMDTTGAYGEPVREPEMAQTDSTVSVAPENKIGFAVDTDASVLEGTVAADASTVLKVYYIRNQYDLVTVVDGVEERETYYYDETITAPAEPTKTGYTFGGWSGTIPATMPARDVTVTAQWTVNKHDIIYMVDGVEYRCVEDVAYGTAITLIDEPTKTGHTFSGWSTAPATMPDADVTVTGTFTINTYTVTFIDYDEEVLNTQTVNHGFAATAPENPTREGWKFTGWDKEFDNVTGDLTVKAQYVEKTIVPVPEIASKTYDASVQTATVPASELYDVAKNIGGTDIGEYDVVLELKDSENYKWSSTNEKTVTLKFNITTATNSWKTEPSISGWTFGQLASTPSYVAKFGNSDVKVEYKKAEDSDYTPTVPTNAGNYTARFSVAATNNYGALEKTVDFTIAKATPSISAPTAKTGLVYDGTDKALVNAGTTTGGEMQYSLDNATWTDDVPTEITAGNYTVYYKVVGNDNYNGVEAQSITVNIAKADMSADITAEGYNAAFDNQAHTISVTIPDGASVKYGTAEGTYGLDSAPEYTDAGTYTVYYKVEKANYNEVTGSANVVITAKDIANAEITLGEALTYTGNELTRDFTVAHLDGLEIDYTVSGNTGTDAGDYELTISGQGNFTGSKSASWSIAKAAQSAPETPAAVNETIKAKADGKITGVTSDMEYKLEGASEYIAISETEIVNLAAGTYLVRYKENANHLAGADKQLVIADGAMITVSFNSNEGTVVDSITCEYNQAITAPTEPTKENFVFAGWYKDAECLDLWNFGNALTEDITLYAKWNDKPVYSINGKVTDGESGLGGITVTLKQGNTIIATTTTAADGSYCFIAEDGLYNIVAEKEENDNSTIKTVKIEVMESANVNDVVFVATDINSELEIKPDTPQIIVGGLDEEAQTVSSNNGDVNVTVKMTVESTEDITGSDDATGQEHRQNEQKEIKKVSGNRYIQFIEINLTQSISGAGSTKLEETSGLIEIIIPFEKGNKRNITVYRYHGSVAEKLGEGAENANADGEYFEVKETYIAIYAKKFSTYAIGYDLPSGGGGSSVTRYTVKFDTDGGSSVSSATVTKNAKVTEPKAPEKDGYTFMGWYTDEALTEKYDFDSKVTKNFTLYAKWDKHDDEQPGTDTHNCPSLAFDDLDITQWYHLDTDYVIENGIFKGTTETTFEPNSAQTRAMMVTVLYRAEGEPAVNRSIPFADVDMGAYYANAVVWAQQNGIVKGISETAFAPNDNITREQIAAIMHRYAQYKGYDVSVGENTNILSYDDFDSISEYAIAAMQWACGSALIRGRTESTLNPKDNATRAEIAAILHRFIETNK